MRLIYPLLWARPGRQACREQSINTAAALGRCGVEVTLMMPRGRSDPSLTAADLRAYFEVDGDFRLVQRASRWAGEMVLRTALWLRQVFADAEMAKADLLYSRIPLMLARGSASPLPFATDHYRPWPDDWPWVKPLIAATGRARRSLGFILHSDYAAQSYRRLAMPSEKILVAHNGADPTRMLPRLGRDAARAALGLPLDRSIALYAGRVNAQKGLDQILLLAELRPETLFVIAGSEGDGLVEQEAARRTNVQIVPWQAPGELPGWLYAADVLLIPASQAPLEQFGNCVLPLKTFAYLAAGRAILAPVAADTAELLRHEHNALLVPADNPEAAADALDRLLFEPRLAMRLGENAAALAETLSWDHRARKIVTFLEERLRHAG